MPTFARVHCADQKLLSLCPVHFTKQRKMHEDIYGQETPYFSNDGPVGPWTRGTRPNSVLLGTVDHLFCSDQKRPIHPCALNYFIIWDQCSPMHDIVFLRYPMHYDTTMAQQGHDPKGMDQLGQETKINFNVVLYAVTCVGTKGL